MIAEIQEMLSMDFNKFSNDYGTGFYYQTESTSEASIKYAAKGIIQKIKKHYDLAQADNLLTTMG